MFNISIYSGSVESGVSRIINEIQQDIIGASSTSKERIMDTIKESSGDFIDSLREEMSYEAGVINEVGELLILIAEYIRSASKSFADVDAMYDFIRNKELGPVALPSEHQVNSNFYRSNLSAN